MLIDFSGCELGPLRGGLQDEQMSPSAPALSGTNRGLWALWFGLLLWLPAGSASANTTSCRSLFQRGDFAKASACFVKAADTLGEGASLAQAQKIKKGRLLRNAAASLRKAADQETKTERKAHLYWQAIQILKRYTAEGLYESEERKKGVLLQQHQLNAAIGYSTLTLVASQADATLVIKGYLFSQTARGNWSQRVRPGRYQITMRASGKKQPVVRELHILPNETRVFRLSFPTAVSLAGYVSKRQIHKANATRRTVGFVLLGVGAAVAIGGGVMLGVAFATEGHIVELSDRFSEEPKLFKIEDTRELVKAEELRDDLTPVGWVLGGVGLAMMATGGLIVALSPLPTLPPQAAKSHTAGRLTLFASQ